MAVKLTPDDRALLVRLTHAKGCNASEVVRSLLRAAAQSLPPQSGDRAVEQ